MYCLYWKLLSTLSVIFFPCSHTHTHTRYILLLNHCLFISLTTLYFTVTLPSSFSLFYNLTLLLRILFVHTYDYTSSNLSLPSLPLPLPLPSTSLLNFLYPFLFSITWLFFFPFYLCKFDIISSIQSIFFLHKNCEYSLSLSLLSFSEFLFFFITLIKTDGFFLMCFVIAFFFFFNFPL